MVWPFTESETSRALARYSRRLHRVFTRPRSEGETIDFLTRLAAEEAIPFLMAISETDNAMLHRNVGALGKLKPLVPPQEPFRIVTNKQHTLGIDREVGIVLPVGCGKSGLITLTPFAYGARRALVVAPNVKIYDQLAEEFDPANPEMFYQARKALAGGPYPEPVPIREDRVTLSDLEVADVQPFAI